MTRTSISTGLRLACMTAAVVHVGCGCPHGSGRPLPMCIVTGGATLVAPTEFAFDGAMSVAGRNCLDADGTCRLQPRIEMVSNPNRTVPLFMASVTLPAIASGTFDLDASSERCSSTDPSCISVTSLITTDADAVVTRLVSGTVVLQRSTATDLDAAFAFQFQTAAGQAISVSNGHVVMTNCQVRAICNE